MTDEQRARIDAYVTVVADLNRYRFDVIGFEDTDACINAIWNINQWRKSYFTIEEEMYYEKRLSEVLLATYKEE